MADSYSYPSYYSVNTIVPVKDQSSLTGTLRSDVVYLIDGMLTMQASITVPDGGLFISGTDANLDSLDCAGAFPLFTGGGNLFIRNCKLSASAVGSSVFDLTATNAFNGCECTNVNFENCKTLGTIDGYRQGLWFNVALFNCDDGLALAGTWGGGFRIETTIVRLFDLGDVGGTVLKGETGATFASRIVSNANIQVNGNATAYYFTEAMFLNDQDFQLIGGELSGTGTYIDGITVESTRSLWASVGIPETSPGGKMVLDTPTATTVSASGTPYKLAGTTSLSDAVWIDANGQSNRMRWLSSFSTSVRVYGVLSLTSGNNNQIVVRLRVYNSSDVLQSDFAFPAITTNGAGRAENITVAQFVTMNEGDYLEVWCENSTSTSNITLEQNSVVLLEQRKAV